MELRSSFGPSHEPSDSTGGARGLGYALFLFFCLAALLGESRSAFADATFVEYSVPCTFLDFYSIASGPDGNLWFTEFNSNRIGKITTSGVATLYDIPTASSSPLGVTSGPDGNLWFTESDGDKIGKITPDGVITEYALESGSGPFAIALGPDGNIWFTELVANKISKITPDGQTITRYDIPTASANPTGLTQGPDNAMWFTEYSTDLIARIDMSGAIVEYPLTSGAGPAGLTTGPDGNLWVVNNLSDTVSKVSTLGVAVDYELLCGSMPYTIVSGPDGALWAALSGSASLAKITTSGAVYVYLLDYSGKSPYPITSGPDGNIWFGDQIGLTIGKLVIAPTVSTAAITGISASSARSGGSVSNVGDSPVTERGVCWKVGGIPTVNDSKSVDGSGLGSFVSVLPDLSPHANYLVRAYATNNAGVAYGEPISFWSLADVPVSGALLLGAGLLALGLRRLRGMRKA
jgi:streptogramin lyase